MAYYHVRVTPKSAPSEVEVKLDLTLEDLTERFVGPYREGRPIVINGRTISSNEIERIRISKADQDSAHVGKIVQAAQRRRAERGILNVGGPSTAQRIANKGEDVTDEFITGPPGFGTQRSSEVIQQSHPPAETRKVFVVHGRNEEARKAIFAFLRSIGLEPVEWSEARQATGKPTPHMSEILDAAFLRAHAVVVLFTPDDEVRLKSPFQAEGDPPHEIEPSGQARPNVLFEAGMAMGRSSERTILMELGNLRPFTDIAGLHVIRMDDSSQRRQELAQRLQTAGCPVRLDGTDWHTAGDFEAALVPSAEESPDSTVVWEQESTVPDPTQISEDAVELLIEATGDMQRMIRRVRTMGGLVIHTNGKDVVETGDVRSEARWDRAVQELLRQELIEDPSGGGQVFEVTHRGFQFSDGQAALENSD